MPPSVVVVDDDPVVGAALARSLRSLGFSCVLVLDPATVEEVLEAHHPDLIVSDLSMPSRSGIDVLLSAKKRFPTVKRCLISGAPERMTPGEFEAVQPCCLLPKPWAIADLLGLINATR